MVDHVTIYIYSHTHIYKHTNTYVDIYTHIWIHIHTLIQRHLFSHFFPISVWNFKWLISGVHNCNIFSFYTSALQQHYQAHFHAKTFQICISYVFLWTPACGPPHMAEQKQDDQLEHTYSSYVRIPDVALKTCQRRWTIGRSGERGSVISMLAARHDDDDIYIYTHTHIYIHMCWHIYLYIYIYIHI